MAKMVAIYVGAPENDSRVTVSTDSTVAEVLKDNNVSVKGIVQHGNRALSPTDFGKTLNELGFIDDDTLHVVKKLDGAKR